MDGTAVVDIRQLRVILGGFSGDGEGGIAGPDGDLVGLVHHYGDGTLRKAPDDIAEKLGREDAVAGVGDLRVDVIGDGGFHIVAGEAQAHAGPAEDALDDGKAAFLSHSPSRDIQARDQHAFFTSKTHSQVPFLTNHFRKISLS